MKSQTVGKMNNGHSLWNQIVKHRFLLFLLMPAVILVFIFCYLPMAGLIMAFQEYDIIGGIAKSPFVGFDNFVKVFTMPAFLKAIKNTLVYSGVQLFIGTPFPIALALLFNEIKNMRFKKVVQTVSYLPYFLSWISVIGMIYALFAEGGPYNQVMNLIFGKSYEFKNVLTDPDNFLGVIFWSNQWKNIGWNSIIFLAAIAGIDGAMYEAAQLDGCSKLKQMIYITLPSIMPTIAMVFIMATGSMVTSNFEQVYGLQNIFIQEETEVINTLVYRQGIENAKYSLATAFGLAQGIVSFMLVFISNKIIKKTSGVGIW